MHDLTPDGNFGPVLSFVTMLGAMGLLAYTLVKLIHIIRRSHAEARAADRAMESGASLAEGPGVVVGTVEFDEGADYAVIVEIRQQGTQWRAKGDGGKKGAYSHSWEEVERRSFAQPFWIRHSSGERIRVEPGQDVALVDRLDVTVHDQPRERFRVAELSAGEEVVAQGTLTRGAPTQGTGYRDTGERGWLLVQGDAARLHLSAEHLGDAKRRLARKYLLRLLLGWVPCAAVVGVLYAPHFLRMSAGTRTTVEVTSVRGDFPTGLVGYRLHGDEIHELVTTDGTMPMVGDTLAFTAVSSHPSAGQIGSSSTFPYMAWFIAMMSALIASLTLLPPVREWHRSKKFEEQQQGKLPEPRASERKLLSRDPHLR